MLHDTPLRHRHEAWTGRRGEAARGDGAGRRQAPAIDDVTLPEAATRANPRQAVVRWLPYGPLDSSGNPSCLVVGDYGELEIEYAALRRRWALMDCPHRAVLRIAGRERREFLDRMVTQDLKGLLPGTWRQTFWLNRKGRIDADLLLVEAGEEIFVDVDVHQAAVAVQSLGEFVFGEDVSIESLLPTWHRLAVFGPASLALLAQAAEDAGGFCLLEGAASRLSIAGCPCVVARRDSVGEIGLELFLRREHAVAVWDALLAPSADASASGPSGRPAGWHAYNIARIETGTPLFNIDFDSTCLPHETGILDQRVSFTKGCYLGQEIVARMQSLGRPKRTLVGLRFEAFPGESDSEDVAHGGLAALPEAGATVHALEGAAASAVFGEPVGQITSSTFSPMLGAVPIAFAMVRTGHAAPGTRLATAADGRRLMAVVGGLRSWPPRTDDAVRSEPMASHRSRT